MRILLAAVGLTALLGAVPGPARAQQRFVVVVHADNPATSMKRDDLSRLFFKRTSKWPGGLVALPVDLSANQELRIAFTSSVHGKSIGAVRAFWQQQIFSGRDVPPPEKGTQADVLEFVKANPGAVGYVAAGIPLIPGVKALAVEGIDR
jgi:ABC-type phosphate transport system substrate-binding protein